MSDKSEIGKKQKKIYNNNNNNTEMRRIHLRFTKSEDRNSARKMRWGLTNSSLGTSSSVSIKLTTDKTVSGIDGAQRDRQIGRERKREEKTTQIKDRIEIEDKGSEWASKRGDWVSRARNCSNICPFVLTGADKKKPARKERYKVREWTRETKRTRIKWYHRMEASRKHHAGQVN